MTRKFSHITFFLMMSHMVIGQDTFVTRSYFDSEATRLKESVTLLRQDSTLQGPYKLLYENGSLAIEGFYDEDESDSTWVYYFENGNKKAEGIFDQGASVGKWSYYFENGQPKAAGTYKENLKEGLWTYYFENGNEKSTGNYQIDLKEGIWNYFYEDGKIKAQAFFTSGKGLYKEFYPSGKLKNEGLNEYGKSEGEWTYYYETGEVEGQGLFKNGLRNGYWSFYHRNGQVSAEGAFLKGEKAGVWKYYFPDGTMRTEGIMAEDEREGYWKLYYPTGELRGEGTYDMGSGEYIEYYPSGKQKSRGSIINEKKQGKWRYFSESGTEDGVAHFEDGRGEYTGYYNDGKLKMKGVIEDDKRVGEWTLYNPDGSVAGVYRPVYEADKPIFRTSQSLQKVTERVLSDKPEYRYKNRRIRYFNPRINEYTGYIIGSNPGWTLFGRLPVAFEWYKQERLGHEAQITWHHDPFYSFDRKKLNSIRTSGLEVAIKQKFYHNDKAFGMFYFGHQIAGGFLNHASAIRDSVVFFPTRDRDIESSEWRFSYGFFIGNRWTQRDGDSGLTIDMNLGFAFGKRFYQRHYEDIPPFNDLFAELNTDSFYLPVIFTLNVGFIGPKRRTTSF